MRRNPGIELFRALLMFGICWLHAITKGEYCVTPVNGRLSYLLCACVPGFLFITGWYGVRLRVGKFLSLWGQAAYCAIVCFVLARFVGQDGYSSARSIIRDNWFLNGYCVMLLLAPLVDVAVDGLKSDEPAQRIASKVALSGLLILVFIWGFATECPRIDCFVPRSAGVGSYSGVCCLGIYAAARIVRTLDLLRFVNFGRACLIVVVAIMAIVGGHLLNYCSPFPFVLMAVCFAWFERRGAAFPRWAGNVIGCLGPTLFSIYLFHNT